MWSALVSDDFGAEFAVEGASIIFRDGGLGKNLKNGPAKVLRAAEITANRSAPEVENYMKGTAPWNDQTGNARSGLFARPYREGDEVGIILGHSVPYGIFLETRWSGRYAVIQPTIDHMGPVVMRNFERLMDRL